MHVCGLAPCRCGQATGWGIGNRGQVLRRCGGTAAVLRRYCGSGLRHAYEYVEPARPYSYIYQGESETLDHVLVTPSLYSHLVEVEVLHINADYPPAIPGDPSPRRVSDHDPLVVVFSLQP